jgi:hypothetical protein
MIIKKITSKKYTSYYLIMLISIKIHNLIIYVPHLIHLINWFYQVQKMEAILYKIINMFNLIKIQNYKRNLC